jgi:hypothetical protein
MAAALPGERRSVYPQQAVISQRTLNDSRSSVQRLIPHFCHRQISLSHRTTLQFTVVGPGIKDSEVGLQTKMFTLPVTA